MSMHIQAAIAAHRFGLGEPELTPLLGDPQAWLRAQIGPADAPVDPQGSALHSGASALKIQNDSRRQLANGGLDEVRAVVLADQRARLATAASSRRPFAERLAMFWSNHFTVALNKGAARGLVGAFEREAIRPHIAGRFVDLLRASTGHVAMQRYLDNHLSAGPHSRIVERLARRSREADNAAAGNGAAGTAAAGVAPRLTGLNENLARELLELHTLGAAGAAGAWGPWGGYSQADVTSTAALLTGWRDGFDANWHEPGDKLILGKRYAQGPQALEVMLLDLSRHPSTARFIATKLARHFVADAPDVALVDRLARAYTQSGGDLTSVYHVLIDAPQAWQPVATKLKTPEEFVVSSARLLRLGERIVARAPDAGMAAMGQRLHYAPSPAGWPDQAEEWLGPAAVWQRIEWASRLAERMGSGIDARQLAQASLGPMWGAMSQQQIERASDAPQALALLLMSPEFQRR